MKNAGTRLFPPRASLVFALIFILLALGIVLSGHSLYKNYERHIKQDIMRSLYVAADLKADQVAYWYNDIISAGKYILGNPLLTVSLTDFLADPSGSGEREGISGWLRSLRSNLHYLSAMLLDAEGRIAVSGDDRDYPLGVHARELFNQVKNTKTLTLSDLHLIPHFPNPHCDLFIPLSSRSGQFAGAVFVRIDPNDFIYKFLRSQTFPSKTSETLILRREDGRAVFLTGLQKGHYRPLAPEQFLEAKDATAFSVINGTNGVLEGLDYNHDPVLAAVRRIPIPFDWYIVTKVDQHEAYLPLVMWAGVIVFGVFSLIVIVGMIISLFWYRNNLKLERRHIQLGREKELLDREYEYLSRYANDAVVVFDEQLKIVRANARASEFYGYSADELIGMDAEQFRTGINAGPMSSVLEKADKDGCLRLETYHRHKDGSFFPVENNVYSIKLEGRKYYQCIIRDITERKNAEAALKDSEEKYRMFVNLAGDAIFVADGETGNIVEVNQQAEKLVGIPAAKLIGMHYTTLHPPESRQQVMGIFSSILKGEIASAQLNILHVSGEKIPVEVNVAVFVLHGRKNAIGIFRDIRERRKSEEALLRYQESLRVLTNRLTLIQEQERRKVSVALHDSVAQTLAIAKMKLAELENEPLSQRSKELAAQARGSVDEAIAETRDLISQISLPVVFELGLEAAIQWLLDEIQKKHGLHCAYFDDGSYKPLREDMRLFLFRSVRELVMNCVKHAHAGSLTIRSGVEEGQVRISVEDDGQGFDVEEKLSIHNPSSGFGIFSIQEQARYLGGYFSLDSSFNKGTRAVVGAPLAQGGEDGR